MFSYKARGSLDKIWMVSDTHFYHANIIKHCNRPFKDVDEMNSCLIKNWNYRIDVGDEVFFLGDFSFNSVPLFKSEYILNQLNGKKFLIKGNHDEHKFANSLIWKNSCDIMEVKTDKLSFILSHYPQDSWHKQFRGSYHFHGHTHNNPNNFHYSSFKMKRLDVGVDNSNYHPISIQECLDKLQSYEQFLEQNSIMSNF